MSEEFAVLDFALVAAPPRAVARALATAEAGAKAEAAAQGPAPGPAGTAGDGKSGGDAARSGGLLSRLVGLWSKPQPAGAPAPLLVQPAGTLPVGVLAREVHEDMGFGGQDHEMRLSAPVGDGALTLIELRERTDGAPSPRLEALSRVLRDTDILGFRITGARHPGAEYAFCVYRDGATTRRLAQISRHGMEEDADWRHEKSGVPHRIELEEEEDGTQEATPPEGMTPARQATLLARLGIDADSLLEDRSVFDEVIELSTRPGGADPATLSEPSPPAPAPAAPATAAAPSAAPQASPGTPGDTEVQDWEDEVTHLLLDAVSDALPEAEQVPWLDALTDDLEAGRSEAALSRARALLARGSRPEAERDAAARRLAELFGLPQ